MKRVLKSRLSILAAFAVLAAVGCGGGGDNPPTPSANGAINFSGAAAEAAEVTESTVIPPTGGVSVESGDEEFLIPSGAGTAVVAGDTLATFPAGVGLLGDFAAGSTLRVNGVVNSGAMLGSDGLSDQALGFPVSEEGTPYTLAFPAGTLDTTRDLTVGEFVFSGKWYLLGFEPLSFSIPVPISIDGTIPQNGQNARGADVVASFLPGCNGREATLRIVYGGGTGFVLEKTQTISGNQVRFTNFQQDSVSVPNTGVSSVSLIVGDLPND